MKIANTLLAAAVTVVVAVPALAFDNYKDFRRDHWDFDASADYYRTESNFGSGGNQESLGGGNFYQIVDLNFGSRYVWGPRLALFGSVNVGMAESKNIVADRQNSSMNEILLGGEYLIYSGLFDMIPEVSVLVPTDTTSKTSGDTVANTEGVLEVRPKLTLQKDFGPFGGYAYGGFTYRDQGRSFLLPWGVGTFLKFSDSRLGAEIFGYQSVTDDKDTNNQSTRALYLVTADAGSYKYGSFNPSLVDTNFFYHMGVHGAWSFEVAGGLSLVGTNAANGYHVGALIRYSFDMSGRRERQREVPFTPRETPRGRSEMYNQEPELMKKSTDQFREDTNDGVDQRLFRPKPITPVIQPDQDPALQQQLDDTEMQIELKSTKKKKRR